MALNEKLFEIHVDLTWGEFSQRIDISSNQTRLGLMGPTGCGKTTLVKELLGISQRAKGQICFQQRTLLDSDQKIFVDPWLRSFAYAPQDFQLMPHMSVKENILFADQSRFNDDVVQELGLKKILGRFPGHLSGGEKQRVALARALCQTSRLLILDEPFSALDKESRKRCLSFVDEYTRDLARPMLIISHGQQELEAMNCETFQISSAQ